MESKKVVEGARLHGVVCADRRRGLPVGGGREALKRWPCFTGRSSIKCCTIASDAATHSNVQCIEPRPLTPPAGILRQDSTWSQN